MTEEQSSYRQIMKATSLFGGVQIFNILIAIIRTKFIAVLLGPLGMGISGLLTTTTSFIGGLTNFGLGTSAVRDIASAYSSGNNERITLVVSVFGKIVWATGLLGMIITIILSPILSQITFGNKEYTIAFILISVTLLINQVSSGQNVLLRGMRQLSYMAKSNLIGSVLGLITTIPLYYVYGIEGIVPAIIISAITTLILTWYFARKLNIKKVDITIKQTITEGKLMLQLGFMISLSSLINLGASYLVRIFISNTGGIEQVGLYNAGFTLINTYVGLVFTAMSTDYYPRLSAVAQDNEKSRDIINQQSEIAILILGPLITTFIIFIQLLIILLYSKRFLEISEMIHFAILGTFFKAGSWAISYIFLAKGESKLYFWNEFAANLYLLIFNIVGYYFGGLTGIGISYLISYIVYFLQVFIISNSRFDFNFNLEFRKIFIIQFLLSLFSFIIYLIFDNTLFYIIGILIIIVSSVISFRELDKRLNVKEFIPLLFKKLKK